MPVKISRNLCKGLRSLDYLFRRAILFKVHVLVKVMSDEMSGHALRHSPSPTRLVYRMEDKTMLSHNEVVLEALKGMF